MTRRRDVLRGAVGLLLPGALLAEPSSRREARIGILGATSAGAYQTRWDAFRAGMQERGYTAGANVQYVERWANGQLAALPMLAAELAALNVDVIVTHGVPSTKAAQQAGQKTPIVMAIVTDPVKSGLVTSFARPDTNTTGSAWFAPELAVKRLSLVRELRPAAKRVGVLTNPDDAVFTESMLAPMEKAAGRQGLGLRFFGATDRRMLESAMAGMAQAKVDAVVVHEQALLNSFPAEIAQLGVRYRLPSVGNREFAEAGGLIGYGADLHALFRRAAYFVDRILRGTPPRELPIEQASEFELVLNAGTARSIGVAFPQSMSLVAGRVIG